MSDPGDNLTGRTERGFTLVEVVVVISIIAITAGIAIFNHSDFREQMNLANEAQRLKMDILQAQSDALGVKDKDGDFEVGYGVYFNREEAGKYYLYSFKILDRDELNSPWSNEDDEMKLQAYISAYKGGTGGHNNTNSEIERELKYSRIKYNLQQAPNAWSVAFRRPRSGAMISEYKINPNNIPRGEFERIEAREIILTSQNGNFGRVIKVNQAGQISIDNYEPNY